MRLDPGERGAAAALGPVSRGCRAPTRAGLHRVAAPLGGGDVSTTMLLYILFCGWSCTIICLLSRDAAIPQLLV